MSNDASKQLILAGIGGIAFTLLMGPLFGFTLIGIAVGVLVLVGVISFFVYMKAEDRFATSRAERLMALCFGFCLGCCAVVFILSKILPFFNR